MNFSWNYSTIKWYREANEHSRFFKNIADLIAPKLKEYSTFCDIGCGLGLLDLEISKNIKHVTCIDIDKNAVESLKESITQRKIKNIDTCLMNCDDIVNSWDVICISFFRSSDIEKFLHYCKKLFAVVERKNERAPELDKYRLFKKTTCDMVETELKSKGIQYYLTEAEFEFGQPLVSIDDAKNYIRSNTKGISERDLNDFLSNKLIQTDDSKYPFYIEKMKSIGIFEIKGEL